MHVDDPPQPQAELAQAEPLDDVFRQERAARSAAAQQRLRAALKRRQAAQQQQEEEKRLRGGTKHVAHGRVTTVRLTCNTFVYVLLTC